MVVPRAGVNALLRFLRGRRDPGVLMGEVI
jgi:hypothetical protein